MANERWITVHPNGSGEGVPVKLDGQNRVIGGAGGKLNGKQLHQAGPSKGPSPGGQKATPVKKSEGPGTSSAIVALIKDPKSAAHGGHPASPDDLKRVYHQTNPKAAALILKSGGKFKTPNQLDPSYGESVYADDDGADFAYFGLNKEASELAAVSEGVLFVLDLSAHAEKTVIQPEQENGIAMVRGGVQGAKILDIIPQGNSPEIKALIQQWKSRQSGASSPSAPSKLPEPPEGTGAQARRVHRLAQEGDIRKVEAQVEVIKSLNGMPKTLAYANSVLSFMRAGKGKDRAVIAPSIKITIHDRAGRPVFTMQRPAFHRARIRDSDDIDHNDYMELVEQFLAYIESKASVGDDAQPGHPFYGNQYTEGNYTAKPKEAKSKIPKHAVHELLSSGHPFHIDELAEITGHVNKTSLSSWISMFKKDNPKGKLDIVKVGPQTYQVVKKDGTPAPAAPMPADDPDAELVTVKMGPAPNQNAPGSTKGAEPSSAPTEAPAIDPDDPGLKFGNPSNYAAKAAAYLHPPITVPTKPMTKAEADKVYADQHQHQIQTLQKMGQFLKHNKVDPKNLEPQAFDNVATAYKAAKSAAMAQWATNTKGVAFEPKPSTVFPEDLVLMQNLALSTTQEEVDAALAQWKKDTHNAKLGKSNEALQKAQAEKEAAQAAAQAAAKKEEAEYAAKKAKEEEELKAAVNVSPELDSPLKAPAAIVPEGHKHISSSDFDPDPTSSAGSSKFKREMMRVHNIMVNESTGSSQGNKQSVQKKLEARLKDAPHFQALQAQYVKGGDTYGVHKGSLASRLIGQWATSSGDHHAISVASQLAIREAFKMDPSKVETKAFHYLQSNSEETTWRDAAKQLGCDVSTPAKMEVFKKGMQDFALAQYHETQEFFKSKGIKELHLVRGMRMGGSGESTAGAKKVKLKLQPASSFTVNRGTAAGFAGTGSMFAVKVPVEQVMGSYLTGYGCTGEHEVVVLAHESLEGVQMGVAHAKSTTSMDQTIQLARKYNGGVIPGEAASAAASSSGSASAGATKSYISSPTPPVLKVKVPPKPWNVASGGLAIKNAAVAGDWPAVEQKLKSLQAASMQPGFSAPNALAYAEQVYKAYLEAKAVHATKMQKWKAYHQKHKTGVV